MEFILLSLDYHKHSIHFLDVTLYDDNGRVQTVLYCKPTYDNTTIRVDSSHPRHTIKNLPIGEYVHTLRACSTDEQWLQKSQIIDQGLHQCGNSYALLNRAKSIARGKNRFHVRGMGHTKPTCSHFLHFRARILMTSQRL